MNTLIEILFENLWQVSVKTGKHSVFWNDFGKAAGVYFYKISSKPPLLYLFSRWAKECKQHVFRLSAC
jgi:hypothetical protein